MHEMSIAIQIVEIAKAAVPADLEGAKVDFVDLRLGKLTAVVPDSLRFCFGIVSRDTTLAGAELRIDEVPVVVRCRDCGADSDIDEPPFICGSCTSGRLEIISGRELTVTSIEVADPPLAEQQWKSR